MTWRGQEGTYNAEGITALANALRVSQSLYSIDVGYNGIDQAAALELLAAMKEKVLERLWRDPRTMDLDVPTTI